MAEIARLHARGDHQVVELNLANADPGTGRFDQSRAHVHADHFAKHYADVLLLLGELPDWGGDLRRCKHGGRHLIEQRLEYVVIASVDQDNICIAMFQSANRGDPSKSAPDDYDTLSPHAMRSRDRRAFAVLRPSKLRGSWPDVFQGLTHGSPLLLLT